MKSSSLLSFLTILICFNVAVAEDNTNVVSLDAYLGQVRSKHDGVKASEFIVDSTHLIQRDVELLTEPSFFSSGSITNDSKQNPFFPYTRYESTQIQAGAQEQTEFGTTAKLSYNYTTLQYVGTQIPKFYQTGPLLEFSQSLWRNGFGSEIVAQKEQLQALNEAQKFSESYKYKSYLFEAESNYWRLALGREATQVSKNAVDRAKRIFDYSQHKASLGLADNSDFLQSKAALEARKLDLRISQEDEQTASRAFNSSRGVDSDTVDENLSQLTDYDGKNIEKKLKRQTSMQTRDDVKAAQEQSKATIAAAKLSQEKDRPSLEVFGQLGINGFDTDRATSIDQSFGTSKPTEVIGVRLNFPLNFAATHDANSGWREQQVAAKYNLERKIFEQERDWHDLNQKYDNAMTRYEMYETLSAAQKAKLRNEKDRHSKGRTTLVNVINFEVDYLVAELSRIRTLAEILQIHAQLKLFGDTYESR